MNCCVNKKMINIRIPKITSYDFSAVPLLNQSQSTQNSLELSPLTVGSSKIKIKSNNSDIIDVKITDFQKQKQILQWRTKTEFPIVKIKNWKILSEKRLNEETNFQIFIELNNSFKSLKDFQKISFIQSIYVLKESLIGFQRLYYHFGKFSVSSGMIKFTDAGSCKVWINQDPYLNYSDQIQHQTQKQFIYQLCEVIKNKTTRSSNSKYFFEDIQKCKYFFQAIGTIDTFVNVNKIKIPNCFQILDECKSPLLKKSMIMGINQQHTKLNLTVSNKIPAFIKKNQVKKKNSNQTETPSSKKLDFTSKIHNCDRSLTDLNADSSIISLQKKQQQGNQMLKTQNKMKDEQFVVDVNAFCQGLHIRLIEPVKKDQSIPQVQNPSGWASTFENNPETSLCGLGRISDFDSSEDHKSRFSLYQSKSKQYLTSHVIGSDVKDQIAEHKRMSGPFSQCGLSFPNKTYNSKDICMKEQIQEDFQHLQVDSNKLSPHYKHYRDKRKYSGDLDSYSSRTQQKILQNLKKQMPKFLTSKNRRNKDSLSKSPSHQVISLSCQKIESQPDEKDDIFLRGTLMINPKWNFNQNLNESKKQTLPGTKQTPRQNKSKTNQVKKLATMGRQVGQTIETQECEFELEYGNKIEKQKSIRNELMNILI